jgi:hypothetical protein
MEYPAFEGRVMPETIVEARLRADLTRAGHVFVPGAAMRPWLERCGSLADWERFTDSWGRLEVDGYMADQGRYRRRRHATFTLDAGGGIRRNPHRPHFQSRDYNPVHGGIERWYEPIEPDIAQGASFNTILRLCHGVFGALPPQAPAWFVEAHQFRIEALADQPGQPTPEGIHRDGVDYVLVLMIRRDNIASGVTSIHAPDGRDLGSFTLSAPFDAVLIDDARVYHGVTAVTPLDPAAPGYRDVLVVTFRRS